MNPILNTDSYKGSHFLQYPPDISFLYAYIESRGITSSLADVLKGEIGIVNFGLQAFMSEYLKPITKEHIEEASDFFGPHGVPFNREGWQGILDDHGGNLPVIIEGLPEGTVVPIGTPQVQITNTDFKSVWLPSYLEQALLRGVWYPSTVATISREAKKIIAKYLMKTQGSLDGLEYKLHDFGGRGVSSFESAGLGGMAHLLNFRGTDTIQGILAARKFYRAIGMPGVSLPASEHSTITSWGSDNESGAQRNMLTQFGKPGRIFASVGDSYNIFKNVKDIWGTELKTDLLASQSTLVVRPDSGVPWEVCPEVLDITGEKFGFTTNTLGFKVLPFCIRVIWGDGMNLVSIEVLLKALVEKGWCISNITLGMGGGLLQKLDRDTFKYAMKTSAAQDRNGVFDVFKDPITDPGKVSKKGIQAVVHKDGKYQTMRRSDIGSFDNLLEPVYKDGDILRKYTFEEVIANASL